MRKISWKNGAAAAFAGAALAAVLSVSVWAQPTDAAGAEAGGLAESSAVFEAGNSAESSAVSEAGAAAGNDAGSSVSAASGSAAVPFEIGALEGKTYVNRWADIRLTCPESTSMRLGDGSNITYPLAAGEHVDPDDPELGYRMTVDFLENTDLESRLSALTASVQGTGYTVDSTGSVTLGGYEYQACRTSLAFSDGTAHHIDTYLRPWDGRLIELEFIYYEELKPQVDSILESLSKVTE